MLSRGRAEHRAIFRFKRLNNLFPHSFNVVLTREHLDYNTRSKDIVKLFQIETGAIGLRQILLRTNGII